METVKLWTFLFSTRGLLKYSESTKLYPSKRPYIIFIDFFCLDGLPPRRTPLHKGEKGCLLISYFGLDLL